MTSNERNDFWKELCKMRDNNPEHIKDLRDTIKWPDYLCRFRSVNENSLTQLQENKLYYSSADYYDDPFDTFIHVDYTQIKNMHMMLSNDINEKSLDFTNCFKVLEEITGISRKKLLNNLRDYPFDLSAFSKRVKQVRTMIQKNIFSICFCENQLNETLWIKYANNYRGFVLVYDLKNQNTFLCGKEEMCKNCRSMAETPSIYPVYYTDKAYDATKFALACMLWEFNASPQIMDFSKKNVVWEAERVSLIKKKCHEYDNEWRMIRPTMMPDRTCIKMKPNKVILGLKMPEYERLLVISAAKIAGISNIEELYINDSDQLQTRIYKK